MATERFSGKVPDFLVAAQAGSDLGDQWAMQREMQDAETAPQAPAQPGLADLQGAAPQPFSNDGAMQRRAEIMRKYGQNADADRMLQVNSQIGLTNAQTGEVRQRTANEVITGKSSQIGLDVAQQANDKTLAVKKIRDSTTAELGNLTDADGAQRAATPDELFANQQKLTRNLYSAGYTDHAEAELKRSKAMTADRIDADSSRRKEASNIVQRQVMEGDYRGVPGYIKQYASYGGPDTMITAVSPAANGMVSVTATGPKGSSTKQVPEAQFRKTVLANLSADASDNAAVTLQANENIEAQIQNHKAGTEAHLAAAGASGASARRQDAETGLITTKGEREATLEDARSAAANALNKEEGDRTPADTQAIKKWTVLQTLERQRSGAASGSASGARTMNGKVGGQDVTIRTYGDGTSEYLAKTSDTDRTPTWKPLTRGQAVAAAAAASPPGAIRPGANGSYDYVPTKR